MRLADLTSPDANAARGSLLVIPIGSTEQHGPHLPLSTDTDVAVALATRLAERRPDVVVAPALAYGSSGEHQEFAGTLSIGQDALELVLIELVRSATETFERVLLLSAHGGNAGPVGRARQRLHAESRDVRVWSPRWDGDAHAGRTETALQLALAPHRVRMERAATGNVAPIVELMPLLRKGSLAAVSPNGVLGDPVGATADEGDRLLRRLLADLIATVEAW